MQRFGAHSLTGAVTATGRSIPVSSPRMQRLVHRFGARFRYAWVVVGVIFLVLLARPRVPAPGAQSASVPGTKSSSIGGRRSM